MDRRVTPRKRVTSPTWGSPPPCKQALTTSPSWWSLNTYTKQWRAKAWRLGGSPHTYHANVNKLKWAIIRTGRLPYLSGLPHLLGVPLLHVRRAKECDPVYLRRLIYWLIDWQIIVAGRCQKFDYGREGNLRHYHQVCLLIVGYFSFIRLWTDEDII